MDGSDGLEKLYTNSCDLVLTDINMSNMDGYEFIRRVLYCFMGIIVLVVLGLTVMFRILGRR